jgi:replicative DNA helicase
MTIEFSPWDIGAEQAVLGGLLRNNKAWDSVGDVVAPEDFYDERHRFIFEAIGFLLTQSQAADAVTVVSVLKTKARDETCGGVQYLLGLNTRADLAFNIRSHAELVHEKALHRSLVLAADQAVEIAEGAQPVMEKTERIASMFARLQRGNVKNLPQLGRDLMVDRADHWESLKNGERPDSTPTPIRKLNSALNGGFRPGKVYVLAARPSVGKSSFAEHLALRISQLDKTTLFLTQEMEASEVMDRATANLGEVDYGALQRGDLSSKDWSGASEAMEEIGRLKFYVDDQPALRLADIRAKAMSLRRDGLYLLVVDYLQLCAGSGGAKQNRNTEIEEISRGLKALAKEMSIAVLVLSQLNREVEKRNTPEPTLADLRDSGAIEQDADVVMFLWRVRMLGDQQIMALSLPKNRQGRSGERMALAFEGKYQRWYDSEADISNTPNQPMKTNRKQFE